MDGRALRHHSEALEAASRDVTAGNAAPEEVAPAENSDHGVHDPEMQWHVPEKCSETRVDEHEIVWAGVVEEDRHLVVAVEVAKCRPLIGNAVGQCEHAFLTRGQISALQVEEVAAGAWRRHERADGAEESAVQMLSQRFLSEETEQSVDDREVGVSGVDLVGQRTAWTLDSVLVGASHLSYLLVPEQNVRTYPWWPRQPLQQYLPSVGICYWATEVLAVSVFGVDCVSIREARLVSAPGEAHVTTSPVVRVEASDVERGELRRNNSRMSHFRSHQSGQDRERARHHPAEQLHTIRCIDFSQEYHRLEPQTCRRGSAGRDFPARVCWYRNDEFELHGLDECPACEHSSLKGDCVKNQ